MEKIYLKSRLLDALKKAGLPHTHPNFLVKYEQTICTKEGCPHKGKPYLASPRNSANRRQYTDKQIADIIAIAKAGWFEKHWHWLIEGNDLGEFLVESGYKPSRGKGGE